MAAKKASGNPGQIILSPVDRENWREVAHLEVAPSQREFVAEPSYYLALCCYGDWNPLAICLGGKVIGFMMWAVDPADGSCWLGGILIDLEFQRKGYGRQAVKAAISRLADQGGYQDFALSYQPENTAAANLYRDLGFIETGEWEDEEKVARFSLSR